MKKRFLIFAVLCVFLSLFVSCGKNGSSLYSDGTEWEQDGSPENPPYGGTMVYHWEGMNPSWDVHAKAAWLTFCWAQNVYEGILARGADGVIYPGVCEYEYPEDGLYIKLWVRDGVRFSNGDYVDIEDVLASLQRVGKFIPKFKRLWEYIDRTEINDKVLTIYFKEFYVEALYVLAEPRPYNGIMPKEICEKYGENQINDLNDVIGCGPYKINIQKSRKFVNVYYDRNEFYKINESSPDHNGVASPKRQYLDHLELKFIGEDSAATMSYLSQDLDFLAPLDVEIGKSVLGFGNRMIELSGDGSFFSFFNCTKGRVCSDLNLRKAIACALDWVNMFSIYGDGYGDYDWHCPAIIGGEYDKVNEYFLNTDYVGVSNMDLAREYLAKSNYNGEPINILAYPGALFGLVIRNTLVELGLNVQMYEVDMASFNATWGDPDLPWDIGARPCVMSSTTPSAIDQSYFYTWLSTNKKADSILRQLRNYPLHSKKSLELWNELAHMMAEECPFMIYGVPVGKFLVVNNDLEINRDGDFDFYWNAYWHNPSKHTREYR